MKYWWQFVLIVVGIVVCLGLWPGFWGAKRASAVLLQRVIPRTPSDALPWFRMARTPLASHSRSRGHNPLIRSQPYTKLRFTPVRIQGMAHIPLALTKKLPGVSRTLDQKQRLPELPPSRVRFGIRVDMEAAYGNDETIVGRLHHGTQFEGAHYAITGHWETTQGAAPGKPEDNLTTRVTGDLELTEASKILLDGSYRQSYTELPQFSSKAFHEKSEIQAQLGYQVDVDPALRTALRISWNNAHFTDHRDFTATLTRYGSHLTLRKSWSGRNMISFDTSGAWEEFSFDHRSTDTRYYSSAVLLNSFALSDRFSLDVGGRVDYYHSRTIPHTDYLMAPVLTSRLHLFQTLSWYVTYHPRLKIPNFTDLYIQKLYTLVNPELHSEKRRHSIEVGFQQRFGEALVLNVGGFYHDSKDFIVQIDTDHDNLLEYEQIDSVDFLGARVNMQMHYREHLVQNITYTYRTHDIFSTQRLSSANANIRNEILTYQPHHQVQASLVWKLPFGLTCEVDGLYVSEQYRNRSQAHAPIDRRFFVNVELTQRLTDNLQIFIVGRNVTNTSTYDIIPWLDSEEITSSRIFLGGIRLRF